MNIVCAVCSNGFKVKPYLVGIRKHCSKACKVKANTITKPCQTCGKDFVIWKSVKRKGVGCGTWCSKACMVEAKKAKPKKPKIIRHPVFKVCETCEKAFRIPPARLNSARWCSRDCQSNSEVFRGECSEAQRGEKSWRWTGKYLPHKDGYVRLSKISKFHQSVRFGHLVVMIEWMLEDDPSNPFLIVVDGRPRLQPGIVVHHVDRVRNNNARSNLLAVTVAAHSLIHKCGKKPEPWECWPRDPSAW